MLRCRLSNILLANTSAGCLQIKQEMAGCLDFLSYVHSQFDFTFQLKLSTRPENYLGDIEVWNEAEKVRLVPELIVQCAFLSQLWRVKAQASTGQS